VASAAIAKTVWDTRRNGDSTIAIRHNMKIKMNAVDGKKYWGPRRVSPPLTEVATRAANND
jgi:hypothetical protein